MSGHRTALLLAAALLQACTFDPNVPSARVLCHTDGDCPVHYACEPLEEASIPVSVCCKERGCAARLGAAARKRIEAAAAGQAGDDASVDAPPGCGNGQLEQGETCDPPSSCPQSCPQQGCETFTMTGSPEQCNARCVSSGQQMTCQAGDKCCPAGCTGATDSDCNCTCGNGMVEAACGETCDPLASCPTSCPPKGCMLRRVSNPGTCRATCVDDKLQDACVSGDGCCPPACNAANDKDCQASCGNGAIETGETCDPPSSCPTKCPAIGCTLQKLEGSPDTCTARCVDAGKQMTCASGDSCCPMGCTTANDTDCSCTCGNGMVEAACGETCDPLASCPTTCPPRGCQLRKLVNGGGCQAQCVDDRLQTACMNGDGCCPSGCNATNDTDCMPKCNNGAIESGETCDPQSSCPTTCPWMGCARRKLTGAVATCTAACADDGTQTACAHGDGCCPPTCNASTDNDCKPKCGNGVVEAGEKCDGNCPMTCPNVGCQKRKLMGDPATCSAECVNDTVIATCTPGDGCCASGCTSVNDSDCSCQCGNGVVEAACGEKCDGNCPTSCPAMGCQLRTLMGTGCGVQCVNGAMETQCKNGDSCCPSACNANNDNNCTPVCGNSVVETGETCDPPSACQTQSDACVDNDDTLKMRTGVVAQCTFKCMTMPRPCLATTDAHCPSACTPCGATCTTGQDIDCRLANGAVCSSNNQCSVACTDGHCCAGTGACPTCSACTGANGSCVFLGANVDDTVPAGACAVTATCDGAGHCLKKNGQTCGTASQCQSNRCVDGYCCNSDCTASCDKCNVTGSLGTCTTAPAGADPSPGCSGYACTGSSTGCPINPSCGNNSNCATDFVCIGGSCVACRTNGMACGNGNQCCSGVCNSFNCL
jgi:hypothetical protein